MSIVPPKSDMPAPTPAPTPTPTPVPEPTPVPKPTPAPDGIANFLAKAEKMSSGRSKELRLTFDEVNLLAIEIAQLLNTRLTEAETANGGGIIISGGDFTST